MNDLEKQISNKSEVAESSDNLKVRSDVECAIEDPYKIKLREQIAKRYEAEYVGGFHFDRAYVQKNRKYFFVDINGDRINDEEYDSVENFSEGVAAVCIEDSRNETGYQGKEYTHYFERHYHIDLDGNRLNKEPYSSAGSFGEGLAAVGVGEDKNPLWSEKGVGHSGNVSYIDKEGNVVIEGPFTSGGEFKNGFAEVGYGFETGCKGCYGPAVIDRAGEKVLDHGQNGYNCFIRIDSGGSDKIEDNFVYQDLIDDMQCGAYDLTGDRSLFPFLVWHANLPYPGYDNFEEEISKVEFPVTFGNYTLNNIDDADALREKICEAASPYYTYPTKSRYYGLFKLDEREGWILSTDQSWQSEYIFHNSTWYFSENRMAIMINENEWIYIDEEGNLAIDQVFTSAEAFSCGVAAVSCDPKKTTRRLIKPDGSFACDQEFEYISTEGFKDGVATAVLKGQIEEVFIDTRGQIVFS